MPGDGVYTRFGYIHSGLAGVVQLTSCENATQVRSAPSSAFLLTLAHCFAQRVSVVPTHVPRRKMPSLGCIVTCKVTHIGPNYCRTSIHCVEDTVLRHSFRGMIRKEDIRETEKGAIEIYKCFRVGDIVLARVVGVGENHSFLLSTAEDELGVSVAYSQLNKATPMLPVNWTQMRCPKTYVRELRKVAKINFDADS